MKLELLLISNDNIFKRIGLIIVNDTKELIFTFCDPEIDIHFSRTIKNYFSIDSLDADNTKFIKSLITSEFFNKLFYAEYNSPIILTNLNNKNWFAIEFIVTESYTDNNASSPQSPSCDCIKYPHLSTTNIPIYIDLIDKIIDVRTIRSIELSTSTILYKSTVVIDTSITSVKDVFILSYKSAFEAQQVYNSIKERIRPFIRLI